MKTPERIRSRFAPRHLIHHLHLGLKIAQNGNVIVNVVNCNSQLFVWSVWCFFDALSDFATHISLIWLKNYIQLMSTNEVYFWILQDIFLRNFFEIDKWTTAIVGEWCGWPAVKFVYTHQRHSKGKCISKSGLSQS